MPDSNTTLLIINPGSRSGGEQLDRVRQQLSRNSKLIDPRPLNPQEIPNLIRQHAASVDRIVIGGGDGTINLSLDALVESDLPLGILPLGTANDLARSLGIPSNTGAALDIIEAGHTRTIDIARANEVRFVNAIGMGIGPQVTREMDSQSKSDYGVLAYPMAAIRALRKPATFFAEVIAPERKRRGRYIQITVANGIHYGGGMTAAEDAKLDDGLLDILMVPPQSSWSMLASAFALRGGQTRTADSVMHLRSSRVTIKTDTIMEVTVDGEFLTRTPLECSVEPGALRVFSPLNAED